jgi:putative solute:sodium symporter small subunit
LASSYANECHRRRVADSTAACRLVAMPVTERQRLYWHENLRLAAALLAVWFVVTFVAGYFARDLSFSFFGWPFSVWVGGQGALIVYGVITWHYARVMNRLDGEHDVDEEG